MVGNHKKNGLCKREEYVLVKHWGEVTKRSSTEENRAAPVGYSTRAAIDPRHRPTNDLLWDHHLKKRYGRALANLVVAVGDLTDP